MHMTGLTCFHNESVQWAEKGNLTLLNSSGYMPKVGNILCVFRDIVIKFQRQNENNQLRELGKS